LVKAKSTNLLLILLHINKNIIVTQTYTWQHQRRPQQQRAQSTKYCLQTPYINIRQRPMCHVEMWHW